MSPQLTSKKVTAYPSWISGYTSNINIPRYAAIFEKKPGPEKVAKILMLTKPAYENALLDEQLPDFVSHCPMFF